MSLLLFSGIFICECEYFKGMVQNFQILVIGLTRRTKILRCEMVICLKDFGAGGVLCILSTVCAHICISIGLNWVSYYINKMKML